MHGVYAKGLFSYESKLPEYNLSTELSGKRITSFKIDDSEEEKIYDADGNEVDEIPEDAEEEEYTKTNVKVNADENLTTENYLKSKEIFEGRLNELGVEDYNVRLNETNGNIIVELPDDTITDTLLQYLLAKGDFSMTDSEDGTVLLDKSDVKLASVKYGNDDTGAVEVYLDIQFTSEGSKKLEEVSKEYLKVEESEDSSETTEQKKVTMTIEGTEFLTTYFGEVMTGGELTISVGSGTDNATVYGYATNAQVYAMLINNDEMPLTYTIEMSEYMASPINTNLLYIIIGVVSVIALILIIYMIIKFKTDGLFCSISFIFAISIFLLMIRYTSTTISLGSITAMLALIIFDAYFMIKILKDIKEDPSADNVSFITYGVYIQRLDLIIALLVIAVVFTFMPEVKVFSIGMTLFYGIVSLIISNLAIMRNLLIAKHK